MKMLQRYFMSNFWGELCAGWKVDVDVLGTDNTFKTQVRSAAHSAAEH